MPLNENEDKILPSNIIGCIIVIKAAVTASKRFRKRVKKTANDKEERKLLQRKILQIYCWPTDTIPYLMGL